MTQWFFNRRAWSDADEPARDLPLGSLLREISAEPAMSDADWRRLADRILLAVHAHPGTPWWSYAERWRRAAVPLALAAGLVGALALWDTRSSSSSSSVETAMPSGAADLVTAVIAGTPAAEAASFFASSVTSSVDISEEVLR